MRLGLGLGLPYLTGGEGGFDPANLFANGEKGFLFDFTDPSTLFQNSNGTTAVAADGDPIGYARDLSGNGNHATQATNARRPTFNTGGNRATFNTSRLATPAINLTAGDEFTLMLSFRNTGSATAAIVESSSNINTVGNVGSMLISVGTTGTIAFSGRGDSTTGSRTTANITRPYERLIECFWDLSQATLAGEISPRIDGVVPSLTDGLGPLGGGNLGNFAFNLGARANETIPMSGALFLALGINRALSAGERAAMETLIGEPIGFFP